MNLIKNDNKYVFFYAKDLAKIEDCSNFQEFKSKADEIEFHDFDYIERNDSGVIRVIDENLITHDKIFIVNKESQTILSQSVLYDHIHKSTTYDKKSFSSFDSLLKYKYQDMIKSTLEKNNIDICIEYDLMVHESDMDRFRRLNECEVITIDTKNPLSIWDIIYNHLPENYTPKALSFYMKKGVKRIDIPENIINNLYYPDENIIKNKSANMLTDYAISFFEDAIRQFKEYSDMIDEQAKLIKEMKKYDNQ